jgi:hypothetical protein
MTATASPPASPADARTDDQRRLEVFCSSGGTEVFHPIVYNHEVWKPDPFDVETIHAEARTAFQRLLNRAASADDAAAGRILLLLGESGSGKTHLMRAFRNSVHEQRLGYCGYLPMTSNFGNYARYVLGKLIESLDQPYYVPDLPTSGLMVLSRALFDATPMTTPEEREQFREGHLDTADLAQRVYQYADCLLIESRFARCDLDVLRALLYLQRDDNRVKSRVLKYFRCEDLAPYDREVLGQIVPRNQEETPLRTIAALGQVMWAAQRLPLVVCFDQLEDLVNKEAVDKDAALLFRRVIDTVCAIVEQVPSSVLVVSCLEDYFQNFKAHLSKPKLDRIEKDPDPLRLESRRTGPEVEALVARRLQRLYEEREAPTDPKKPTAPFTSDDLSPLTNLRTRDVLDFVRKHRERCIQAGGWLAVAATSPGPEPTPTVSPEREKTEQSWNDFMTAFETPPPDEEYDLAELLACSVAACSAEVDSGVWFGTQPAGRMIEVEVHTPDGAVDRLLVAVCNRGTQGGGLGRQVKEVQTRAGENKAVLVRSTNFPTNPKTEVCKQVANVITKGGRRVVVEDTSWRTMLALRDFRKGRKDVPGFGEWLRRAKPLTGLRAMQEILKLDSIATDRPAAAHPPPAPKPPPIAPPPPPGAPGGGPLVLGVGRDCTAAVVALEPRVLTQHAAFLGGTGSGKTTLALNLIEQLLLRGVPALLLDRKGDLCVYADDAAWERPLPSGEDVARRQRLRERIDVRVYTPGRPDGRSLAIPIVPEGAGGLSEFERDQLAGFGAAALGGMMEYKSKGRDAMRLAILRQAVRLISEGSVAAPTLPDLIQFINERDPSLITAVGVLDVKQFGGLAQDLQTLWLRRKGLLEGGGERLNMEALLGLCAHATAGKTRLSVISTKYLGDATAVEFWIAQLLLEATRWASRKPSSELQAVFLFDEADQYLPAVRQPATKAPMENLLRRGRSAGVGLLLATQSPGDFDYKCRDNIGAWFVGKITQDTALDKMRPLFSECRVNVAGKVPAQDRGQFHLMRPPEVVAFAASPSLLKTDQLPEDRILELARKR